MNKALEIETLSDEAALCLAETLETVLNARTHKHNHLGEKVVVKGSLSKALKLPEIIKQLNSTKIKREQAKERLSGVWYSLSSNTSGRALKVASLYHPEELNWEAP